ncbi:MAG: hypothetical protein HY619_04855 [Thaumarchaeota archaeon]|nr:hypothetical protein [Nitrososphaerota archaeon]
MVEPALPVNVGHVARLAKNFGAERILFINPSFDPKEAQVFSAHGADMLLRATAVTWKELVDSFDILVGTTATQAKKSSNIVRASLSPAKLAERLRGFSGKVCVVLGREATGLRNQELKECDIVVTISTGTKYGTLNIGHALAIVLHELSNVERSSTRRVAAKDHRELITRYAATLADLTGYPAHKAKLMKRALKQVLGRSGASERETLLIIGLLRKAILAVQRKEQSRSLG